MSAILYKRSNAFFCKPAIPSDSAAASSSAFCFSFSMLNLGFHVVSR
ncbi:hypothetical protein MtrunA17_Chr3g0131451 [Medicago truncatula]|uniref:Uncharacterized protein n=1 Tax=Medicago truncatula TaxID=3880 RepID=A0A396J4B1_MEDTR|nr:hypothetical protein MtrunA17_Chr3g0131451 [Medicago truncatula]